MTRRGANEGTIRNRKDGARPDGRRTRRSLLGRSRAEVRDKLQVALRADSAGLPPVGERLIVGAFLDLWLRDAARPKVRSKTSQAASIVRIHLQPGLGRLTLARLTPQQVQAFLNAKAGTSLAPRTVAYIRAVSVRPQARPSDGGW